VLEPTKAFSSFSVNDLKRAKEFYGGTLGLDIEEKPEGLSLDLPGTNVFIYPKPNHQPATFTVLNFAVENVEETVDELKSKGIKFEKYDSKDIKTDDKGIARGGPGRGPTIAWFKDPDGNFLSVMSAKE
jgi:catechol 2,3-dioxygenase-like lactoylglutathione lyase family enzyme